MDPKLMGEMAADQQLVDVKLLSDEAALFVVLLAKVDCL
jgi:hypothetical protein